MIRTVLALTLATVAILPAPSALAADKAAIVACLAAKGEAELFGAPYRCMVKAGLDSPADCTGLPSGFGIRCMQEIQRGQNVERAVNAFR